jgi:hypothetical protein
MMKTMTIDEHCQLSYFDRNLIERAIDQSFRTGNPVRITIKHRDRPFQLVIGPRLNKAKVLASRS